jgi:hypothetical protein
MIVIGKGDIRMNNQENENDHLPNELENRVESVIQRIDGLEKQMTEMIETLTNYFIQESKNLPDQASN